MHDAGDRNQRILLTLRHGDVAVPEDFTADTTAVPTPGPGQFLSRTLYLSLDPDPPSGIGDVVPDDTVAQVMQSRHPDYRAGEFILTRNGWQQFALSSGQGVRRLDPDHAPISTALGVLGLPGLAGYAGALYFGEPKPGETVLVTAACGPSGSTAGQVARLVGARAVGFADSRDKCDYAVRELGFAACVNLGDADWPAQLRGACPEGVDVFLDACGIGATRVERLGPVLDATAGLLSAHARVVLCGAADAYRALTIPAGTFWQSLVAARATVRSVVVREHLARLPELVRVVGAWIRDGRFRYREDIQEGLARAPEVFCGLTRTESFGKALVRVAPERL
jgi:NADPH-dependent curcumin reductase CurA